ncbi:hypothetical protein OG873_16765 [Streptomyces violaceus]|uniref:Uncharacterized protein n=1 Tax=Streptomyces violaceus TaxID=1936 RepID=A0ABZ1NSV5_STRVL
MIRKLVGWVRLFRASATQSTELRTSLPVQRQVVRPTSPLPALQRLRRDPLRLAAYGVDLDTRGIHACLREAS